MSAWSSLKQLAKQDASSSSEPENNDEQEQIRIARALIKYRSKQKIGTGSYSEHSIPFQKKFTTPTPRPPSPQRPPLMTSKILPLLYQKTPNRPISPAPHDPSPPPPPPPSSSSHQNRPICPPPAPYAPVRYYRATPHRGMAPPVTMRTAVPVFSAPPMPPPAVRQVAVQSRPVKVAPPVCVRQAVPVFSAPPPLVKREEDGMKVKECEAVKCLENLKL